MVHAGPRVVDAAGTAGPTRGVEAEADMRIFLPGQRRELAVLLAAPTVAAAAGMAQQSASGLVSKYEWLRLRVHEDGLVRCRAVRHTRSTPPHFRGHLRATGGGVVLQGVIRESRASGFVTALYSFLTLLMAAVAVLCALSHPLVVPGLVICSVATIAFGILGVVMRGQRVSVFRIEADSLEAKIWKLFGVTASTVARR
jgi:hypothetical protein